MNPPALVVQQLALEGIDLDGDGRLVARPAPGATDVPRIHVCRHATGESRSYRADVPDSIVASIEELSIETIFTDVPLVKSILRSDAVCRDVWLGSTYTFRDAPAPAEFPDVVVVDNNHRLALENFDPTYCRTRDQSTRFWWMARSPRPASRPAKTPLAPKRGCRLLLPFADVASPGR